VPCWERRKFKHPPGTPILYNTNLPVKEGGGTFRARFGVERIVKRKVMENGRRSKRSNTINLLAEGSYSPALRNQGRISRVHLGRAQEAWLGQDLTAQEMEIIRARQFRPIRMPYPGRSIFPRDPACGDRARLFALWQRKARMVAWNLPDPIPVHREPILYAAPGSGRRLSDLAGRQAVRVPNIGFPSKGSVDRGISKLFPLILSSGRLVEYEGGGEETLPTSGSPS